MGYGRGKGRLPNVYGAGALSPRMWFNNLGSSLAMSPWMLGMPRQHGFAIGSKRPGYSDVGYSEEKRNKRSKLMYRGKSSSGYLAGKVRARLAARRRRRRGGKRRLRRVVKRLFKGISYQTEYANTASGDKCVYIGHTTAHADELLTMLCMVCIKDVLQQVGIYIPSWNLLRASYVNNGDIFQFVYKVLGSSAEAATFTNFTVAAAQTTFADIATNLAVTIKANMSASSLSDGFVLTQFQYIPTGGKLVKLDLMDAIINFFIKSSLKIQNRSVAAGGDDEMDVNNVPVYGKLYNGTGNGAIQRTNDGVQFVAGANNTLPISVDGSGIPNFSEPPDASEFTHVRKFGKVYINPGHIKTSVLKFRSNINITRLFQLLNSYYILNNTSQWINLGAFNMFALERVIAKLGTEASPGINLTYEVDYKGFMTLKPNPQKFTAPYRIES